MAITVIEARSKTFWSHIAATWQHRSFYTFLFTEISMKKFRDTMLGFWWLILRPLIPTAITVILFSVVVPIHSYGLPYLIFFLSGMLTWNLFQATVIFLPRTLLWMRGLMRRTYFPKLLVPIAAVGPPLLECVVMLAVFLLAALYFKLSGGDSYLAGDWRILWALASGLLALMLGLAVGMVLSVLAVLVRDVVLSVPYFVQLMMLLTPLVYPVTLVPEKFRWILYTFNPMAVLIEMSRWAWTGVGVAPFFWFGVSAVTITLMLALSVVFFVRAESFLADHL